MCISCRILPDCHAEALHLKSADSYSSMDIESHLEVCPANEARLPHVESGEELL